MKASLMFLLTCLLSLGAVATSVPTKPLTDLVKDADHVVMGTEKYQYFLLKGADLQPVYPALFERSLQAREQIEKLLVAKSRKH
jgi:hypothetical protein